MGYVEGETAQFPIPSVDRKGPFVISFSSPSSPKFHSAPHHLQATWHLHKTPTFCLSQANGILESLMLNPDSKAYSFLGGKRMEPVSLDTIPGFGTYFLTQL